jgi:hypothetical protein
VVFVAIACAVLVMLPAPLPGHVVSSNDTVRALPPYPGLGAQPLRNGLLTDPAQVFRPDLEWARDIVRSGHLPVWDPLVFSGRPLRASQQAAPLFPVSALSYVLPYDGSIAWRILVLLVLAIVGTWLFARRLGLGSTPAAVSALAFGLSAPLIDFSNHPQLDVYVLPPWLMLGTDRVARGSRGGVALFAAALGLAALGGNPQSLVLLARSSLRGRCCGS